MSSPAPDIVSVLCPTPIRDAKLVQFPLRRWCGNNAGELPSQTEAKFKHTGLAALLVTCQPVMTVSACDLAVKKDQVDMRNSEFGYMGSAFLHFICMPLADAR